MQGDGEIYRRAVAFVSWSAILGNCYASLDISPLGFGFELHGSAQGALDCNLH